MKNGPYELVIAPDDYPGKKYRGRYCYEHHLVWWKKTGNVPRSDEVIHHRNTSKRDNKFQNLQLKKKLKHNAEHAKDKSERSKVSFVCAWCKKTFKIGGRIYRHRLKQSKSGNLFCSLSHGTKFQFTRVG